MNPLHVINSISGSLKHLALAVPLAAALWLGAGPSAQAIPTDALIHYTFDPGSISGATVTNNGTLGAAANGTMQNATSVAGQFGDGLSFTGTSSGVRTTGNVTIGNAFTFACWVSTTNANNNFSRIIMNNYQTSGYLGTNNANPGRYLTIVKNQFVTNTTAADTSGAWHHLAMTWDGTAQRFYYDGVLVGSPTSQTGPTTLNTLIGFGCNSNAYSECWNGKMDEAFVFGRALSVAEIGSLFTNAPNNPPVVPTSVAATPVSSGTVNVSWAADSNAASRTVSVYNTVTMGEQLFNTSAATSYSVTGLTDGTLYDFKVLATNALGSSAYSSTASATPGLSSAKNILTFLVPGKPDGVISGTNISVIVPYGTVVTNLAPTYSISASASQDATFPSGSVRNFNSPQTYTITAQDSTTQTYTVTVTVAPFESHLIWNVAGSGPWDLTTVNWKGQLSSVSMPFENAKNAIFDNAAGGTITIAAGILPASTTVSAASGAYVFSGVLGGVGSLTKSGNGTLQVRGYPNTNTFSGGTLVDGGVLGLGYFDGSVTYPTANPLGSGPVTLSSGSINFDRVTASNALTVNGGQIQNFNGWGSEWSGPITLNATLTTTVPNYVRLSGVISGDGGITKTGGSLLDLYGINTYSGDTTVSAGSLTLVDNAGLRFALTDDASNKVTGAGTATFDGDFTIDTTAVTVTTGTWTLVNTTTKSFGSTFTVVGFTANGDGVTWAMTDAGKTWTFVETTGVLTLTVAGSDYDTWAAGFPPADVSNPVGDNDGDGLTNQQEYAFGLNPTLGSSVNPITVPLNKTTGMFTYTRRATPAASGLTYAVFISTDLATWMEDFNATETVTGPVDGVETVEVTLSGSLPLTDPALFVRVQGAPTP